MPGAYLVLALIFGAAPRLVARISLAVLALTAIASLAFAVGGIVLSLRLYPLTDLVIAIFALSAGVWIGRVVPPKARSMAILLAVLAALDSVQVFAATAGDPTPSPFREWTTFVISTPFASTAIGFGDLVVVTAIGEHWRRRGGNLILSVLPGFLGLVLVDAFVFLVYRGGIPLVPFLLAGWLVTEVASRIAAPRSRSRRDRSSSPDTKSS